MRLGLGLACLLLVGCVGPHSTAALWAQQNLERELVAGRQTDAERAAHLRADELALADESLALERARIQLGLGHCPAGTNQPIAVSSGDRVRDAIRLRIGDDAPRQVAVAQVALADWRLRRAAATGEAHFCAEADQALTSSLGADGTSSPALSTAFSGQPTAADFMAGLGSATVTRDPRSAADQTATPTPADPGAEGLALSNYALGYVDAVRARSPLPQYLAAVYGGVLTDADAPPRLNLWVPDATDRAGTLEDVVDLLAPRYPQWEPDAIYAALRPA